MKRKSKRKKYKTLFQEVCHPNAAGADIGAEEIVIAIPADRDENPVRTFGTFNDDLQEAVAWLKEKEIATIAMESTGNYWVAFFDFLREAGIDVCLVNARHVKGVPGRKTDVCDAQWIQQVHTAGLLRCSFVPEEDVRHMRYLYRHREDLIRSGAREIQHMQKVFNEMNVQLHHVISDIDGWSGQRIIQAIIDGERDPAKLAALRHSRCRTPLEDVIKALDGNYRDEYVFVLKQAFERWHQSQRQVSEAESVLGTMMSAYSKQEPSIHDSDEEPSVDDEDPGSSGGKKTRPYALKVLPDSDGKDPAPSSPGKHDPCFDLCGEARRIYGTDLSLVPGVSSGVLGALLTEVGGPDQFRANFKNGKHFASWIGLCPDNRISGGKHLSTKTRKVKSRIAYNLRLAAGTLWRSDNAMGDYCRRMKARLGKPEGITATAHKLARILFTLITTGRTYNEEALRKMSPATRERRLKNLAKQAKRLGLQLVEA